MAAPAASSVTREIALPLPPTTWGARIAILLAAVGGFVTLRIDRFLSVAIQTDWLPEAERLARASDATWCESHWCARLPADWLWISIVIGLVTTALVLYALWRARAFFDARSCVAERRRRAVAERRGAKPGDVPDFVSRSTMWLLWTVWGLVGLTGVVVAVLRYLVARDMVGMVWLTGFGFGQLGLVVIALALLARIIAARDSGRPDWSGVGAALRRQRATIVIGVLFAALVLFLPIGADQVADAIRSLTFGSPSGAANVLFLVAAAALLSAAMLETWRATERAASADPVEPTVVRFGVWFIIGGVLLGLGIWWGVAGWTGGGIAALGGIVVVFGLLELGVRKKVAATSRKVAPAPRSSQVSAAARYVAVIPLVALCLAIVGAVVEMGILEHPAFLQWSGPAFAAAIFAGLAVVVTRTLKDVNEAATRRDPRRRRVQTVLDLLTVLLNVAILVLLWLGFAWPDPAPRPWFGVAAAAATAVAFVGHLVVISLRERDDRVSSRLPESVRNWSFSKWVASSAGTLLFAIFAAAAITVGLHLSPIDLSRDIGTLALMVVFVSGLVAIVFGLAWFGRRIAAPRTLSWFGVRGLPVFTAVLVWWVVAGLLAPLNLHDVRVVSKDDAGDVANGSLESAFTAWAAAQPEFADGGSGDPSGPPVPLVLVATHGGGIRAAYWTAVVLDCVVAGNPDRGDIEDDQAQTADACSVARRADDDQAPGRIFLASAVSGGAVGLAAYSEQLLEHGGLTKSWVDDTLTPDLLPPVIGWALFHDLPNHLVGLNPGTGGTCRPSPELCLTQDRAAILEQSIDLAQGTDDDYLRSSWTAGGDVPLMVFNSSTAGEPRRAVTSQIDLAEWPRPIHGTSDSSGVSDRPVFEALDSFDLLCTGQDLRISTSAVLAARFPYISPTGHLHGACTTAQTPDWADPDRCRTSATCGQQLSDGGDLENSGLLTIGEILPTLQSLVRDHNAGDGQDIAIVVLDIDNDYRSTNAKPLAPSTVGETLAPLQILLSGAHAMQNTGYGLVQKQVPTGCLITLAPGRQPGIQAPLGWTLSESSRQNLRTSIVADEKQVELVKQLQQWFSPDGADLSGDLPTELASCVPG